MSSTSAPAVSPPASPPLMAVERMPVPSGLVSRSTSPGRAPLFNSTRSGCTRPVTDRPYLSSSSSMECPPTSSAPASRILASPPSTTWRNTLSAMVFTGQARMFMHNSGRPPMA